MAVAVTVEISATLDQYDQIMKEMGLDGPDPSVPEGALFHWVTDAGGGRVRATDVWETREQFDEFGQNQLGPAFQAAGVEGPPEFRFFEVHNYLKGN